MEEEEEEEEDRVDAQGGRGRKEGEMNDENLLHEESHVSDRHMTWWRNAWWVRVNNGPHMRTARGRRRIWRAARQAAEQDCHEEWVGETQPGGERGTGRKKRKAAAASGSGSSASPSRSCSSPSTSPKCVSTFTSETCWRTKRCSSAVSHDELPETSEYRGRILSLLSFA